MTEHQKWYKELEIAGFNCTLEKNNKFEYKHSKHSDYIVVFDNDTLMVFHRGTSVYETRKINLGIMDKLIHAIIYPKHRGAIFNNKKKV